MDETFDALPRLAAQLTTPVASAPNVNRRQGVVSVVNTGSCDITLGGNSIIIPGVKYLQSYSPKVNDTVWIDFCDTDPLIIGSVTASAWTTWSPNMIAAGGGLNVGTGGSGEGRYRLSGKTCTGTFNITFGTAGVAAGTGLYQNALPFAPRATSPSHILGQGWIYDSSANSAWTCILDDGGGNASFPARMLVTGAGGTFAVASTVPFTWAINDILNMAFNYEIA